MKRVRKILLLVITLLLLGVYIALIPNFWTQRLVTYINTQYLYEKGWTLKVDRMTGHLLANITGDNISLENQNGTSIIVHKGKARLNLLDLMHRQFRLDMLDVQDINISVPRWQHTRDSSRTSLSDTPLRIPASPIDIDQLRIRGSMDVAFRDTLYSVSLDFEGRLKSHQQELHLSVNQLLLDSPSAYPVFHLRNSQLVASGSAITVSPFVGQIMAFPFEGEVQYNWDSTAAVNGQVRIQGIKIPDTLSEQLSLRPVLSDITTSLRFTSDLKQLKGILHLTNARGLNMKGDVALERFPTFWQIQQFELVSEPTEIRIQGIYEQSGRINGSIHVSQLDIGDWVVNKYQTDLTGVILTELQINDNSLENIELSVDLEEHRLFQDQTASFSGSLAYLDKQLNITDPLSFGMGATSIIARGTLDLDQKRPDLSFRFQDIEPSLINPLLLDSLALASGRFSGNLDISESLEHPKISGEITGLELQQNQDRIASVWTRFQFDKTYPVKGGFIRADIDSLRYKDIPVNHATVDVTLEKNQVNIENLHLVSGNDYMQISGTIDDFRDITLQRLQVAYAGHFLVNPKPVDIWIDSTSFGTRPFTLHVDDGVVEGVIEHNPDWQGRLKVSNVKGEIFSSFIPDERFRFQGNLFGELGIRTLRDQQTITMDASLKSGKLLGESFDDLLVSLMIKDKILHIDDITMIEGDKTGLQISGVLPLKQDSGEPIDIDLRCRFNQFRLEILTQFVPNFFHLGGDITGRFNLRGKTNDTRFDYDLSIANGEFDILDLGLVQGIGNYDGRRWNLTQFSSVKGAERLEGSGFLPLDFNIDSQNLGQWFFGDSLWVNVHASKRKLDFLSQYISTLDSVTGDIDLSLQLSGSPERIIRDGSGKISNGTIYLTTLDNPIQRVDSRFTIADNLFYIQEFDARMARRGQTGGKKNVGVSGELNLTKFFEPRYNVQLKGDKIYFRSLSDNIEGMVNADLKVTGKDSMIISGDIAVDDVELTQEFESSTVTAIPEPKGRVTTIYKINFPITGELTLINRQVDAVLSGEVSYTKISNLPADYAGELFVDDGRFYYSGGIFKGLKGYMFFDGNGFNPYLDFSAYTVIEDERIDIQLVGPIANPDMILSSEHGYSQSDILQLLTWRKRFDETDLTSTGFGNRAQAILGAWFEGQLEKNLMELSGLEQLGLVDDVTISGTQGLLKSSGPDDFEIKADLSQKISLNYAYRRSFSLTTPSHMLGVEYKVNRYLSIVGNVDRTGNFQAKYRLRYSY